MSITRLRRLRAGLFALLLGTAVAGPAAVSMAAGETSDSSFPVVTNVFRGALRERTMVRGSVELEAGRRYRLTLSCDEDCSAIGLGLVGPAGQKTQLRVDGRSGSVELVPLTGGRHQLLVMMGRCNRQPCLWQLEVRAARGASVRLAGLGEPREAAHKRRPAATARSARQQDAAEIRR